MSRLTRLMQLMQALRQHPPPVTAETLAQDTAVSVRTIYRDIETLRSAGAIIDGSAGFGYQLTEDPSLPPMMFDGGEIEALVLGLREVRAVADSDLAASAASALAKLRAALPERQRNRLENAVLYAKKFRKRPELSFNPGLLRQATWDEAAVTFGYSDASNARTSRTVWPLSIVFLDDVLVLLAWCCLREDFRIFRLDRIANPERTGASFRPRRVSLLRDCLEKIRARDCLPDP